MSRLTPDERAQVVHLLRNSVTSGQRLRADALADRLEAEADVPAEAALRELAIARGRDAGERDEAREALRELCDALKRAYGPPRGQNTRLDTAVQRAGAVLRTHALVPVEALKKAHGLALGARWPEWAEAFEAAARGERVDWPVA